MGTRKNKNRAVTRLERALLRHELERRGVTFKALARRFDVTYRYVQFVLSGQRRALRGKGQAILLYVQRVLTQKPRAPLTLGKVTLAMLAPRPRRRAA